MSATRPVVLVIDDVHAAARPTASMLLHAVRQTTDARLLFVVTYRDTELGRTQPWAATLGAATELHLPAVELRARRLLRLP